MKILKKEPEGHVHGFEERDLIFKSLVIELEDDYESLLSASSSSSGELRMSAPTNPMLVPGLHFYFVEKKYSFEK